MREVWKYVLPFGPPVTFSTPRYEFRPVMVGIDPAIGLVGIWAEVDPDAERLDRAFVVYATGEQYDRDTHRHIGSFIQGGALVWHVFEVLEPLPEGAE